MSRILGVGINDADYAVQKHIRTGTNAFGKPTYKMIWICPYYKLWRSVIVRCYSSNIKNANVYENSTVCEDWLKFSVFREWVLDKPIGEGMALDKDILISGNKMYSPQTCAFVPTRVNSLLTCFKSDKGAFPVGVSARKNSENFIARIHDGSGDRESVYLGSYATPEQAHFAWQTAKANVIDNTVQWWKFDPTVNHSFRDDLAEALWTRADKLRQDMKDKVETTYL